MNLKEKTTSEKTIHVVGGGLAGSECAYQLAHRGHRVKLFEMRGKTQTPAHKTDGLAELVCSNSLGSTTDYSAPGQMKWEAQKLNSLILRCAQEASVPAGMALGVDREIFSRLVTEELSQNPNIEVSRERIDSLKDLPRPTVICTGPLTHEALAQDLLSHFGDKFLYFYDAIAPIIDADSINMEKAWLADRWDKGTKDYLNCPLNKEQYFELINDIKSARKIEPKDFETTEYFEGCMPVEEIINRGPLTLRFGPASPKGLINPKTGKNEFAVVQLRKENRQGSAYNMVGFQTKMAYGEQTRIFRKIPGLEDAEFLKLGSIHRNLYINSTKMLNHDLSSKKDPQLHLAGQITGVEGYFDSTCIGLLNAIFVDQKLRDLPFNPPPRETALGSLLYAITGEEKEKFQPTNISFGLFPELPPDPKRKKIPKREKRDLFLQRAKESFSNWLPTIS